MAEKQAFVQIVDRTTGKIEKVENLADIEALSAEEKLALARNKSLFVITHRLEPIVKVELKKTMINSPLNFGSEPEPEQEKPIEEITELPIDKPKTKGRKPSK